METVAGADSREEQIGHMVALYQLPLLRLCMIKSRPKTRYRKHSSRRTGTWTVSGRTLPKRPG